MQRFDSKVKYLVYGGLIDALLFVILIGVGFAANKGIIPAQYSVLTIFSCIIAMCILALWVLNKMLRTR